MLFSGRSLVQNVSLARKLFNKKSPKVLLERPKSCSSAHNSTYGVFWALGCKTLSTWKKSVCQLSAHSLARAPKQLVERPKGHFCCFLGARLYKLLFVWTNGVILERPNIRWSAQQLTRAVFWVVLVFLVRLLVQNTAYSQKWLLLESQLAHSMDIWLNKRAPRASKLHGFPISLSLSLSLCLSHSLSVSLSLSILLSLTVSVSVSVSVSLSLPLSHSFCLSLCLFLFLSLSLSLSRCLSVSVCLYLCLCLCLSPLDLLRCVCYPKRLPSLKPAVCLLVRYGIQGVFGKTKICCC